MFAQLARRNIAWIQPRNVANLSSTLPRAYSTPSGLNDGEKNIYNKLSEKFKPTELAVQDVSGV